MTTIPDSLLYDDPLPEISCPTAGCLVDYALDLDYSLQKCSSRMDLIIQYVEEQKKIYTP